MPGLTPPREPEWARTNWQSYCVRLDPGIDQKRLMQGLLDEGVATRRAVMCAHREATRQESVWRCSPASQCESQCLPRTCERLIESERATDNAILLPLFPQMTEEEQDDVVTLLSHAVDGQLAAL